MNQYERIAVFRLLQENPQTFKSLGIKSRSNKTIVTFATNRDHTLIRYANENLQKDIEFLFLTQKNNPHKLRRLIELYPELRTEQTDALLLVYDDPKQIGALPAKLFGDPKFVRACKISAKYRLKELDKQIKLCKTEEERKEIYKVKRETSETINTLIEVMLLQAEAKKDERIPSQVKFFATPHTIEALFLSQGNDPRKLKQLRDNSPQFKSDAVDAVICAYEDPFRLKDVPAEAFKDAGLAEACRKSAQFKIKEVRKKEKKRCRKLSSGFLYWTDTVMNLVDETIELKLLELRAENTNENSPENTKLK